MLRHTLVVKEGIVDTIVKKEKKRKLRFWKEIISMFLSDVCHCRALERVRLSLFSKVRPILAPLAMKLRREQVFEKRRKLWVHENDSDTAPAHGFMARLFWWSTALRSCVILSEKLQPYGFIIQNPIWIYHPKTPMKKNGGLLSYPEKSFILTTRWNLLDVCAMIWCRKRWGWSMKPCPGCC